MLGGSNRGTWSNLMSKTPVPAPPPPPTPYYIFLLHAVSYALGIHRNTHINKSMHISCAPVFQSCLYYAMQTVMLVCQRKGSFKENKKLKCLVD